VKVAFYLRGGQTVTVKCEAVRTKQSNQTGELVSYEIDGITGSKPLYIRIGDISAVVRES
jgi:hypothetical protein